MTLHIEANKEVKLHYSDIVTTSWNLIWYDDGHLTYTKYNPGMGHEFWIF